MAITVVIPTYNRLAQFKLALESCLSQTLPPDQIIIGDDSKDDLTEEFIALNYGNDPRIVYKHNKPSLGQGDNVEDLMQSVKTDYLVLLHDDDLLFPNALEDLLNVFNGNDEIDVAFGKQILIDDAGNEMKNDSDVVNNMFFRTPAYAGRVLEPMSVVMRQQLPSNSFLVKTELAKRVHYGNKAEAGNGVDFHFCYKLGLAGARFKYIDTYISYYRKSGDGISRTTDSGYQAYKLIDKLQFEDEGLKKLQHKFLSDKAPIAIVQALNRGKKDEAWQMYFSKPHTAKILSPGGVRRFFLLAASIIK